MPQTAHQVAQRGFRNRVDGADSHPADAIVLLKRLAYLGLVDIAPDGYTVTPEGVHQLQMRSAAADDQAEDDAPGSD